MTLIMHSAQRQAAFLLHPSTYPRLFRSLSFCSSCVFNMQRTHWWIRLLGWPVQAWIVYKIFKMYLKVIKHTNSHRCASRCAEKTNDLLKVTRLHSEQWKGLPKPSSLRQHEGGKEKPFTKHTGIFLAFLCSASSQSASTKRSSCTSSHHALSPDSFSGKSQGQTSTIFAPLRTAGL